MQHQDSQTKQDLPTETPLQGWKEIGAYLDRDESTARRWEKEEGLPVRRHRTDRRSSVYAYPSELDRWRASRAPSPPTSVVHPRPWYWAAVAVVSVLLGFGLFLRSPSLDPIVEAGAAGGISTVELCKDCDWLGALSPDGRYLSETDWTSGDIGIRDLESGELRRLSGKGSWEAGGAESDGSTFSPDGQQIAYNWLTDHEGRPYELRVIDAFGENPSSRRVYFNSEFRRIVPEVWTRGERLLVSFTRADWSSGIGFVSLDAGELEVVKSVGGELDGVTVSQDGRWIAYDAPVPGDEPNRNVRLLAADGSRETTVAPHAANDFVVGFTPDSAMLLFGSDRTGSHSLWGHSIEDGELIGDPRILMRDLGSVAPMGVSPEGALIYARSMGSRDLYSAEIDMATGRLVRQPQIVETLQQGSNYGPWLSPTADRLAYIATAGGMSYMRGVQDQLIVRDLGSGDETVVDTGELRLNGYHGVAWSPEGKRLMFRGKGDSNRQGALYEIELANGRVELLRDEPERYLRGLVGWLADGRRVVLNVELGLDGGEVDKTIEVGSPQQNQWDVIYRKGGPRVDGRIIALRLSPQRDRLAWRELGTESIKVLQIDDGEMQTAYQVPGEGWRIGGLAWSSDGQSLIIAQDRRGAPDSLESLIVPLDGGEPIPAELSVRFRSLSMHPDGKTIFYEAGERDVRIFKTDNYLPANAAATQ